MLSLSIRCLRRISRAVVAQRAPTKCRALSTSITQDNGSGDMASGSGNSSKFVHMTDYNANSSAQYYGAFLLSQMVYRQTKRLMKSAE